MTDNIKLDDSESVSNVDTELDNLYNCYFSDPENIDEVYSKPDSHMHAKFVHEMFYNKNNSIMHNKEQVIRSVYCRLPNLTLPAFFDIKDTGANALNINSDVIQKRTEDIAEIYSAVRKILLDLDKIHSVKTKKRILYYFRCLAKTTQGCEFATKISRLIASTAVKNQIALPADFQFLPTNQQFFDSSVGIIAEKRKECLSK